MDITGKAIIADETKIDLLLNSVRRVEALSEAAAQAGRPEIPLTEEKVIELYGFKRSTFKEYRKRGIIPSYKLGKSNIFIFATELNEVIRRNPCHLEALLEG